MIYLNMLHQLNGTVLYSKIPGTQFMKSESHIPFNRAYTKHEIWRAVELVNKHD